jgi:hypothetical protein
MPLIEQQQQVPSKPKVAGSIPARVARKSVKSFIFHSVLAAAVGFGPLSGKRNETRPKSSKRTLLWAKVTHNLTQFETGDERFL